MITTTNYLSMVEMKMIRKRIENFLNQIAFHTNVIIEKRFWENVELKFHERITRGFVDLMFHNNVAVPRNELQTNFLETKAKTYCVMTHNRSTVMHHCLERCNFHYGFFCYETFTVVQGLCSTIKCKVSMETTSQKLPSSFQLFSFSFELTQKFYSTSMIVEQDKEKRSNLKLKLCSQFMHLRIYFNILSTILI